jgi:ribosomal-protein-serine acetyltransferase
MFSFQISDRHALRLLQPTDADELFRLTDSNRAYLRTWLPWLDSTTSVVNTQDFIRSTIQQFADNRSFVDAEWLYDHFVDHEIYVQLHRDWNR